MADITYPTTLKTDYEKLGAVYSLMEQMRLEHNRQGAIARGEWEIYRDKWQEYAGIFKEKQRPLLQEQIALRKRLRDAHYTTQEWEALGRDVQMIALDDVLPDRDTAKVKPTNATSAGLDELKSMVLDELPAKTLIDPTEDFTSADWNDGTPQADPNSRFTVASSRVTAMNITRNEIAYFYRTHAVSGDFEWLFTLCHNGGDGGGCLAVPCLSDTIGHDHTGDVMAVYIYLSGSTERFYVMHLIDGSAQDYDYSPPAGATPIVRYMTLDRTGTTLTMKIYTDASRTSLEDTIACTVPGDDYPYIYSVNGSYYDSQTYAISGYIEDLDLQEVTATEKTSSESGTGVDAVVAESPAVNAAGADTGQGADTKAGFPEAGAGGEDSGSGAEAAYLQSAPAPAGDSGTGVESSTVDTGEVIGKTGEDAGSGVEIAATVALWTGSDSGFATEESVAVPAFFANDTGLAMESGVLVKDAFCSDAGNGRDILKALIAAAGLSPDMRLPGGSGRARRPSKKANISSKGVNI